jgi:hypothetical protein
MEQVYNGICAARLEGAVWKKSQRSNSQGQCVELARLDASTVAIRNSRDPQGSSLIFDVDSVREMIAQLRTGRFDDLAG